MPQMTLVALMRQPLRAEYCRAHIEENEIADVIVVTLSAANLPVGYFGDDATLISLTEGAKPGASSSVHGIWLELRESLIAWSRSGTRASLVAGNLARRVRRGWLRAMSSIRSRPTIDTEASLDRSSASLMKALNEIHRNTPITRIVVFDLFDLPVALDFATAHDVEVTVR